MYAQVTGKTHCCICRKAFCELELVIITNKLALFVYLPDPPPGIDLGPNPHANNGGATFPGASAGYPQHHPQHPGPGTGYPQHPGSAAGYPPNNPQHPGANAGPAFPGPPGYPQNPGANAVPPPPLSNFPSQGPPAKPPRAAGAGDPPNTGLPELPDLPEIPGLPSVPSSTVGTTSAGGEDVDFDDLTRRFEELKKRK